MTQPEDKARENIDRMLTKSGWAVQDPGNVHLSAYRSLAIRNFTLKQGHGFAQKITYRTTGRKPDDLIRDFRTGYYPRIAVTVDMIATGTDIKPLEVVLFMRSVKSRSFFEQMKGRGVRIINDNDLRAVTPDAGTKDHYVIVDAVGVCEQDKTDSRPMDKKKSVPFEERGQIRSWLFTVDSGKGRFRSRLLEEKRGREPFLCLNREDLDEFVKCYNAENRYQREPTWCEEGNAAVSAPGANPAGRWRAYDYEELINRDKASLDIFWLRDQSLEESANLHAPDLIAGEIVEDLEAALEQFHEIASDLSGESVKLKET